MADRLVVLCYHRIGAPSPDHFYGYRPNCSATLEQFQAQMKLIKSVFTPISSKQLAASLEHGEPLPPHPALVTFDDGYRDNGTVAWPIMRELGIPGIVFLATDHIGTQKPFLWDFAAFCFEKTARESAEVPLLGNVRLGTADDRHRLTSLWIAESKKMPADDRWSLARALAEALEVSPRPEDFRGLYLNWKDVTDLMSEGLEFGGHTQSHPILSRLSPPAARAEIAGSRAVLLDKLGTEPKGFAYPNGSSDDFRPEDETSVAAAGYRFAFSLNTGVSRLPDIRRRPMAIRRLYLTRRDRLPRLSAKIARFMLAGA